jgi:hypothetical protein
MPSVAPWRTAWLTPFKTSELLLRQNSPSEALSSPVHVDVGLRINRHCRTAALPVSSVLDQETLPTANTDFGQTNALWRGDNSERVC